MNFLKNDMSIKLEKLFILLVAAFILFSSCDISNSKEDTPSNTDSGDTEFPLTGAWLGKMDNRDLNFSFSDTSYSVKTPSGTVLTTSTIVKIASTSSNSGYFVFKYTRHPARILIGYYGVGKWRKLSTNTVEFCEEVKDKSTNSNVFDPELFDTAEKAEAELRDFNYQDFAVLSKE